MKHTLPRVGLLTVLLLLVSVMASGCVSLLIPYPLWGYVFDEESYRQDTYVPVRPDTRPWDESESERDPQTHPASVEETVSESAPETLPDAVSEVPPAEESLPETEAHPETKPLPKPETKPETLPETVPETEKLHVHDEQILENNAPAWDQAGSIGGVVCRDCGEVLEDPATLPTLSTMSSYYGYTALGQEPNGKNLQNFYLSLYDAAVTFHNDTTRNVPRRNSNSDLEYVVEGVRYTEYDLGIEDAKRVWAVLRYDNPIFYWIDNTVGWNDDHLYLMTESIYAQGTDRAKYHQILSDVTLELMVMLRERLAECSSDADYAYEVAYYFHDIILLNMEYAHENDGETPEDALWAHNIMGFYAHRTGVCETYAKAYQSLLNYCGVENLYVMGDAGGGHAWNLVRMGDGQWYWCDLTWDDPSDDPDGVEYDYFCVNDKEGKGFLKSHTPNSPSGDGLDYLYPLPDRSTTSYRKGGRMAA